MASPLDNGSRWSALAVALFVVGGLSLATARTPALALVNESPSLPRGLYLAADRPPVVGEIVAFRPPVQGLTYLRGLGAPPDARLLKRVRAGPGDVVCRHGGQIDPPDGSLGVLPRDRQGGAMPSWSGCRELLADELFVVGDTATSFDSRYFGPVRRDRIEGVYRRAVSW